MQTGIDIIKVYGFENDVAGTVVLQKPSSLTPRSDGRGGTLLGNIDFVGDSHLSMGQMITPNA